jgi:hypothetical protein
MKNFIIFFLMLSASVGFAQNAPINFESGGYGASWTWTVFENATNPPLEFIANPSSTGINTSATVAKFTALQSGNPWAGCESVHGSTDLGGFVLDATNSLIKIMVWKPVISDVGLKLAAPTGWALPEIKVPNTLINQWEELTFDFSGYTNPPGTEGQYDQIVVFPDFNLAGRTQDNIVYFDNITFNPQTGPANEPTVAAPVPPLRETTDVVSVYSNAYTNVPNTDFFPGWGQSTVVSYLQVQGDDVMRYANFNYEGTTFAAPLNVSAMDTLHIDMWTANATAVNIFCISTGPVEFAYSLPITANQWVSYDIPLTAFAGVNLADIIQFKFDGGTGTQTLFLDNIYFYKQGAAPVNAPTVAAPTPPVREAADVISVYSNAYSNVPNTDFNPAWGQSTVVSFLQIQSNDAMRYANFNYQGTTFEAALNVTLLDTLHFDMWTANATAVNIFCISTGPVEASYSLPITASQWVGYDIPLTAFPGVNLADVIQFKFDGGTGTETLFLDNIYFYKQGTIGINDVSNMDGLGIFPNPVTAGAQVQLGSDVEHFELFDLSGRTLVTDENSVISTEGLDSGIYMVRIQSQNGNIQIQKLIIR